MIISKNHNLVGQKFSYSGTTINKDWDRSLEIKCRIKRVGE